MVKLQLRGDTLKRWEEFNPVIAEREMILISSDPNYPDEYDMYKIGDGKRKFNVLPNHGLPAVQERGNSPLKVMSQKAVTSELFNLENYLKKIEIEIKNGGAENHKQNTDIGTNSRSFLINDVLLKCCCHDLVLRSSCDCDYADLTLQDLYVKGKIYLDKGVIETEIEQVRSRNNMIVLNDGETGSGVAKGISGIEINRGTEEHYYIIFEEDSQQIKAGKGRKLYAIPFIDGHFKNGDLATWNEEKGLFIPGKGTPDNCMFMKPPFSKGDVPMWSEEEQLFVVKAEEESGGKYMPMLPPFADGELPIWDQEQQLFVPTKNISNCMLMDEGIMDGDGVVWNADKQLFVSGIPYDPLCLRKDRIRVLSSLPISDMLEGDIVIIDSNAKAPADTPEEENQRNPYVMKSDIIDDLATNSSNKVLSARQGYKLARLQPGAESWGDKNDFEEGFKIAINN